MVVYSNTIEKNIVYVCVSCVSNECRQERKQEKKNLEWEWGKGKTAMKVGRKEKKKEERNTK